MGKVYLPRPIDLPRVRWENKDAGRERLGRVGESQQTRESKRYPEIQKDWKYKGRNRTTHEGTGKERETNSTKQQQLTDKLQRLTDVLEKLLERKGGF